MAVIAKFDCRVFCHINSLEDKISNTAATKQPNPFWFWEKYHCFSRFFRSACYSTCEGPKEVKSMCMKEDVLYGHIYIQLMKQHMALNEPITRYLLKTQFLVNPTSNFCIFAPEGSRE